MLRRFADASGPLALLVLLGAGCGDESRAGEPPAPSKTESVAAGLSPSAPSVAAPSASAAPSLPPLPKRDEYPKTLAEQRAHMLERMRVVLELSPDRIAAVNAVLERTTVVGQGNPEISEYALTRAQCEERRAGAIEPDAPVCGARLMAPLYDPRAGEKPEDAKVCIDRFEFPNVPCDYPVTWASAKEAQELCLAVGKRLCDAHEWEGACAGALLSPEKDYVFGKPRKQAKAEHNKSREIVWAYGPDKDHSKCATASQKSHKCTASGGFRRCGSNTYPAGSFLSCKSPLGVYDQHGNAAEHMNLPMKPEEFARGGNVGATERKVSCFTFQKYAVHEDDCRWRAPDWHVTKVMNPKSHQNYHLGFRCCKDVPAAGPAGKDPAP